MAIKIITDSASDITREEAAKLGITVIPLSVTFGEETYKDGVDLDHDGFYHKLIETDDFPSTSQVSPFEYEEIFKKEIEAGNEIICITISSKLSGCYQSANIAADEVEGTVHIVDSENVTVGERNLVSMGLSLIEKGLSAEEIVDILNKEKKNIRLIALLDTLEYLKKGGRVNAAVATAGALLSIKPVIAIVDGEVSFLGMARGSKNGNNKLIELVKKENGIDFEKPVCLAYTGHSKAMLEKYIEDSKALYDGYGKELPISTVGCAIGTHIGPGAIALSYFVKQ